MLLLYQIMAGLLDQYLLAGSKDALDMVVEMANYFYKRVKTVIEKFTIERHWRSLNEETGGMNDVLYRLYTVTVSSPVVLLREDIASRFPLLYYLFKKGIQSRSYWVILCPLISEIATSSFSVCKIGWCSFLTIRRVFLKQGDNKHLELAHLFDKPCFLGPLALQVLLALSYSQVLP